MRGKEPRPERSIGAPVFARPWRFLKGVVDLDHLPEADQPEVAFAGRSNVGKSSLLNALVGQRSLARASVTPGRTQEVNYFMADGVPLYLVDLPGYGFARAPKEKADAWTRLVAAYLAGRATLRRAFLLVDARHGLKPSDEDAMSLLDSSAVSYQVVLTKADKVGPAVLNAVISATTKALAPHPAAMPHVFTTSAQTGFGVAELREEIARLVEGFM